MDFIKFLDCFTIKFSFYTNNQPNNQNLLGGIMTILYIIICVLIFIFVSYDDLNRLNPITTRSEVTYSERKLINMNKEKLWIPFRVVNYENKFIDHRDIFYIVPYLVEGRHNETIGMNLKATLLNYTFCNETDMINRPDLYKIDVPLNQLFCFDNDILFGGNWNYNYLNYLEINLYLCEDGVSFNISDPKCSKIEKYIKNINSSLLFDFHFPTVQFQPTNLNNPIQIIYKNYYYRLSTYSYKIEKLYIKENILSDDKNLVKSHYKNSSFWGMNLIYSDDYFLPSEFDPICNNTNTSRIFALNIYMADGLVIYTRTFNKIFLLFSNLFPIFRVLLFFFKKFTQHIKMSFVKKKLIELIFENNKITPIKFIPKFNKSKDTQKSMKLKTESNKSEKEIINLDNNCLRENNLFNKNILNNKVNCSLKEKVEKRDIHITYSKKNYNSFYKPLDLNDYFNKNNIRNNNKITKSGFPYYYFFLDIIFDNIVHPKKFLCVPKEYFTVYDFMCHVYDISSHIFLYKEINILNNLSKEKIDEENFSIYNRFNKININENQFIDNSSKDINNRKPKLFNNYFK